jgi:hypothetical protein
MVSPKIAPITLTFDCRLRAARACFEGRKFKVATRWVSRIWRLEITDLIADTSRTVEFGEVARPDCGLDWPGSLLFLHYTREAR